MYNGVNNKDIPLLNRTGSQICPAPENELLEAVESNNFNKIDQLLSRNHQELLKVIYPYHDKTILLVACCLENIQPKTIEILSKYSDLRDYSEDDGQTAIHFAAQDAKYDILKILLEKRPDMIKDEELDGNNALHYLIRFGKDCEKFQQCLELLVAKGVNINHKNNSNKTPLDYANFLNISDQVKTIIDKAQQNNQKNVQNINNNNATINSNNDELFELLKDQNEDAFLNRINDENKDYSSKNFTLLQFCCEKNLNKAAKYLIKIGANVKLTAERNIELPIEMAENSGNSEIFKLLIDAMDIEEIPIGILVKIMKYIDNRPFGKIHDQKGCYRAYIDKLKEPGKYSPEQISLKINETLDNKFTALYFAIRFASPEIVRELLSLGASLGAANQEQKMAIDVIDPVLLEKHLDDCITVESDLKDSYKSDFTVKFEYRTLIPPYARMTKNLDDIQDPEKAIMSSKIKCETVKEMEVISFMSQTPGLKHLLKHPVIIAFLLLKWKKIQWIFWSNLIFYIIFLLSLITYIFVDYANFSSNASSTRTLLGNFSHIILTLSLFVLIFRELFQIFIHPLNYLKNFENYMEIILIFVASMLIFVRSPSSETRKQLSSLAILLAAFELVLMLGQHPYFSTNVLMLKTVSFNFFKFLIWYSLLIIAFALSFYLLFTSHPTINESDGYFPTKLNEKNATENQTEKAPNNDDDDGNFGDPGRSVFKTIIMLTGEFDASDLNFDTFPITSKLIFVLFIFMIAIILLNLLNGLAVSDTQIIKNDAELVGHIARAQYILHVENMLLGNLIPLNLIRELKTLFCCFNNNNDIIHHQGDKWNFKIPKNPCLFPHDFENYSISFQPNKNGEVCTEKNIKNANLKKCLPCSTVHFNKDVVKKTMEIIKLKNEDNKEDSLKKLQEEVAELKLIIMKELQKSVN